MSLAISKLDWYWRRLRAMSAAEVGAHVTKKMRQRADKARLPDFSALDLGSPFSFPSLPSAQSAPEQLRDALRRDAADIQSGQWKAFGHLDLRVENPPRWQKDYLVGKDLQSAKSAFDLDHRQQPGGADIKIIWEPSRWNQLVRLAEAAYVLKDAQAGQTCLAWLADWVAQNPPYTGLNWTSGLETGIRLIQFAWIDALLSPERSFAAPLAKLRTQILPPHVWFTWRYQSFGSSANNHLLGELAGVVVALARWPSLGAISTTLGEVQALFERETLLQFAEDGGNHEQALGYHLFSWEFCWQGIQALKAAGKKVAPAVEERIRAAARFFAAVKLPGDVWDFGDCDNAFVTPLFLRETKAAEEWRQWMTSSAQSAGLRYWWGDYPRGSGQKAPAVNQWQVFPDSGYAVRQSNGFSLRLDASPLGFLATAAHGHLDALHLSVWLGGQPLVIDPGTGAYYHDKTLRNHLASWAAHNGPTPEGLNFPARFGTFLWGKPHARPRLENEAGQGAIKAVFETPLGTLTRIVRVADTLEIEDAFVPSGPTKDFQVLWKFAPGVRLTATGEKEFLLETSAGNVSLKLTESWKVAEVFNPSPEQAQATGFALDSLGKVPLAAVCSPAFRRLAVGPYLLLKGTAGWTFRSTFSRA